MNFEQIQNPQFFRYAFKGYICVLEVVLKAMFSIWPGVLSSNGSLPQAPMFGWSHKGLHSLWKGGENGPVPGQYREASRRRFSNDFQMDSAPATSLPQIPGPWFQFIAIVAIRLLSCPHHSPAAHFFRRSWRSGCP